MDNSPLALLIQYYSMYEETYLLHSYNLGYDVSPNKKAIVPFFYLLANYVFACWAEVDVLAFSCSRAEAKPKGQEHEGDERKKAKTQSAKEKRCEFSLFPRFAA